MAARTLLSSSETTGPTFGPPSADHPTGGGVYMVLIRDVGASSRVTLQVEIAGVWTDTGDAWTTSGGYPIELPTGPLHRFQAATAGPVVELAPVDRAALRPAF